MNGKTDIGDRKRFTKVLLDKKDVDAYIVSDIHRASFLSLAQSPAEYG